MPQHRSLMLILLTLGVILSGFLIIQTNVQTTALLAFNHTNGFDGFMSDVEGIKMDRSGFPRSTLFSPTFHYYRDKNTIIVDKPIMIITPDKLHHGSWTITSNQALVLLTSKMIHLYGNVRITRNKNTRQPKTQFATSSLIIDPTKDKAFTNARVTIIQPGNRVTAQGLRANLKTGVISLISKASGEFNPDAS